MIRLRSRFFRLMPWVSAAGLLPLLVGSGPARAQTEAPAAVTAFVDVNVLPMDREQVLPHRTVVVQGDRITALGSAESVRIPAEARRIDGRDKFLIPGLSDMHYHLSYGGGDRTNVERQLFFLVANGVTTIRNLDYWDDSSTLSSAETLRLRARTAAGQLLGPRIYTSGKWRPDDAVSIEQNVAAYKAAGYDFIKIHHESPTTLDTLLPIARRLGMPVMGHVLRQETLELTRQELARVLAAPYASIEHLSGYPGDINGPADSVDTSALQALAAATQRAGVWNCPTQSPIDPDVWDTLPDMRYKPRPPGQDNGGQARGGGANHLLQWIGLRRRMIKALQDAGAGLLVGTDTPFRGQVPGFGVHRELAALVAAGLTPYQALVAGTRNAAALFGTLDSSGTVAAGRRADLVLLEANPLVAIGNTRHSAGVMVGGRWLSRDEIEQGLAKYAAATP